MPSVSFKPTPLDLKSPKDSRSLYVPRTPYPRLCASPTNSNNNSNNTELPFRIHPEPAITNQIEQFIHENFSSSSHVVAEYTAVVLSFDDELELHKVHPRFRGTARPDHVLARNLCLEIQDPVSQEEGGEGEVLISRLRREILSKHDMLDTAIEIRVNNNNNNNNNNNKCCQWYAPEQIWCKGIKMDRDGLRAYVEGLTGLN